MRVTGRDQNSVRFETVTDDSKLTQWLRWESSDISLKPIDPTCTLVTWKVTFSRQLDPAWYFAPVEKATVHEAIKYLIAANRCTAGRGSVNEVAWTRAAALYMPIMAAALSAVLTPRRPRKFAGLLLGCLWAAVTLLAVQRFNQFEGWWIYPSAGVSLSGMPLELYLRLDHSVGLGATDSPSPP